MVDAHLYFLHHDHLHGGLQRVKSVSQRNQDVPYLVERRLEFALYFCLMFDGCEAQREGVIHSESGSIDRSLDLDDAQSRSHQYSEVDHGLDQGIHVGMIVEKALAVCEQTH